MVSARLPNIVTYLFLSFLLLFVNLNNSFATTSGCSSIITPSSLVPNSQQTLFISIENQDEEASVGHIQIIRPSDSYTVTGGSAVGWTVTGGDTTIISGGSISPLESLSISLTVNTGGETSSAAWQVEVGVSTEDEGNYTVCDGTLNTNISSSAPTNIPTPTGVSTTTTITTTVTNTVTAADTTKPTIQIDPVSSQTSRSNPTLTGTAQDNGGVESIEYSRDSGSSWTGVNITKGNTVSFSFVPVGTRDGKNTIRVRAKDASGNTTTDTVTFSLDRTGPIITIDTLKSASYKEAPTFKGEARDVSGVKTIDYSLDGTTWSSVGNISDGSTTRTFSINQSVLDDGEYELIIRATDGVGNQSMSTPQPFTIDRLPPRIGAMVVSIGTQILSPSISSEILTIPSIEHTFTVSIIGGPTNVQLHVRQKDQTAYRTIPLLKKKDSNLWSSTLIFENPGIYMLEVEAEDKNATTRKTGIPIHVVPAGKVDNQRGTVSLYTQDITGDFVLWDGSPYGQTNPVTLDTTGNFSFLPPAGMYYVEIKPGAGYRNIVTNAFSLPSQLPVTPQISPKQVFHITIGPYVFSLPSIGYDTLTIAPYTVAESIQNVEYAFPNIRLPSEEGVISPTYVEGKWSLVAVLNTWMPQTPATISTLSQLSKQYPNIRFIVIVPHESSSAVELYKKRGEYPLTFAADPDGILLESLPYPYSPTFYLFNELAISNYSLLGLTPDIQRLLARTQ